MDQCLNKPSCAQKLYFSNLPVIAPTSAKTKSMGKLVPSQCREKLAFNISRCSKLFPHAGMEQNNKHLWGLHQCPAAITFAAHLRCCLLGSCWLRCVPQPVPLDLCVC